MTTWPQYAVKVTAENRDAILDFISPAIASDVLAPPEANSYITLREEKDGRIRYIDEMSEKDFLCNFDFDPTRGNDLVINEHLTFHRINKF